MKNHSNFNSLTRKEIAHQTMVVEIIARAIGCYMPNKIDVEMRCEWKVGIVQGGPMVIHSLPKFDSLSSINMNSCIMWSFFSINTFVQVIYGQACKVFKTNNNNWCSDYFRLNNLYTWKVLIAPCHICMCGDEMQIKAKKIKHTHTHNKRSKGGYGGPPPTRTSFIG